MPVKGYKAFNKGLVCRKFQFQEGETFTHEGRFAPCDSGFHFCENPLDVLDYYPLINHDGELSDFAEVEALGEVKTDGNKSVTNVIKIGAKLGLPGFVKASVDFFWQKCSTEPTETDSGQRRARLAANGYGAQLAASGYGAQLAASGNGAQLAASGDSAQLAASGDSAQLAASGDSAQLAASGDSARLAASGDSARLALDGEYSVGAAIGSGENRIRGVLGNWITLAEWDYDFAQGKYKPICVKSAQIDGELLKADTFYTLKNGDFVEVE